MPPENFESTHKKLSPTQDDDEHEVDGNVEVCWGHLQTCLLFLPPLHKVQSKVTMELMIVT